MSRRLATLLHDALVDRPTSSPLRWRATVRGALLISALAWCVALVSPLVRARPPALPQPAGDVRFGLSLAKRRAIFAQLAADEASAVARANAAYPDDPWSAQDHRGAFERDNFRAVARHHGVSLSQVHLVFDEGIRERWPDVDDRPVDATVVPLQPRRRW